MHIILVTGGRDYEDRSTVFGCLDTLHACKRIDAVLNGGATGADALAREWCKSRRVPCISEPADWGTHGKAAGPIRNSVMLKKWKPAIMAVFPGGAGTEDMFKKGKAAKIPYADHRKKETH